MRITKLITKGERFDLKPAYQTSIFCEIKNLRINHS